MDIAEKYMVVVRTEDVRRASTGELLEKFKDVDQRVQDNDQRDYIAKPTPPGIDVTGVSCFLYSSTTTVTRHTMDDTDIFDFLALESFTPEGNDLAAAEMIETKVLDVLESLDDTNTCLVKFLVQWQVPVCVQEELDGSTDLGPILTITGTSSNSLAVCCQDYVSATWKDDGAVFLKDLEAFLVQKLPSKGSHVPKKPAVNRPLFMRGDFEDTPVVLFKGSPSQISTFSQFLCWIVATFRLPEPKKTTSSSVSFLHTPSVSDEIHEFHISLKELEPLDHGAPGTCWTPLFPSTVMAEGFEVPVHPGVFGLQIPFNAMLELSEIVCDVSLEDDHGNATGIYLDGICFFLYPTTYKELPDQQPVIQWHLKEKILNDEGGRDPAIPPDKDGGPLWTRIPDYETLRTSTTILGYCEKALVQLGTQGSRTGHKRELDDQKDLAYKQVLRISQNMPVIIYDTQSQNERAWMVSQLSMILELFNIWAEREGLQGIQYATASADGGAAAFNVLANRSYSERVAIEKMADEDPSDIKISGIIKRIYGRIQKTRSINANSDEDARGTLSLGRRTIKGWDWLELVEGLERAVSQRRQVLASRMFDSTPCWLPFTDSIPVFFAHEVGDLIVPEHQSFKAYYAWVTGY
ncbi:serine threonine kinase [Fusarium phyllophilum]|uniref:Serine threonine kinase n=1 Tax=Fusarium phyllophilum TaxID=47803 RepID=A0A8H5IDL3_9HYPO|nr:serine threonine kinase [Fusarium phyllophilum]